MKHNIHDSASYIMVTSSMLVNGLIYVLIVISHLQINISVNNFLLFSHVASHSIVDVYMYDIFFVVITANVKNFMLKKQRIEFNYDIVICIYRVSTGISVRLRVEIILVHKLTSSR